MAKKHDVRQRTHEGVDLVMDRAELLKNGSMEAIDRFKEKAATINEHADTYIKKNTKKSVLMAAGIGAAAGALLAAFMMRRKR